MERLINPRNTNKAMKKMGILLIVLTVIVGGILTVNITRITHMSSQVYLEYDVNRGKKGSMSSSIEHTSLEDTKQKLRALRMHNIMRNMTVPKQAATEPEAKRRQLQAKHHNVSPAYW